MKTNFHKRIALLCVATILIAVWQVCGQSNCMATNKMIFPREVGGGDRIADGGGVTNFYPNSYPFNRIAGESEDNELQNYLTQISEHKIIPEILSAEQDTNGNWGKPTDGMQLSVRFRQTQFIQEKMVPVYIICLLYTSPSPRDR